MNAQSRHRVVRMLLGLLLLAALPALAQEKTTITGTVTDATGAIIPNAEIVIANAATGSTRTLVSNNDGIYTATDLGIGKFTLKVTVAGFKSFDLTNIQLNVNDVRKLDVHLTVGGTSDVVTVEANALQTQAETNEVSTLIQGEQIEKLAMNSRNVVSLATLGLGVSGNVPDNNIPTSIGSSFNISFNGARHDHNLWMLDGGEDADRGGGGGMSIMPSPEAIAEFKVLASNYSADYGISSGGTITMVTRQGTSRFHGSLWEYNRNDLFNSHNFFDTNTDGTVSKKPKLRENIFGGNIGGPLSIPHVYNGKDKTFFFVNEEWRRIIQASTPSLANTIPAADFPTAGSSLQYVSPKGLSGTSASVTCPDGTTGTNLICVPQTTDPARLALYAANGLVAGSPFPNSIIPAALIDQNAVALLSTGAFPHPDASAYQVSVSGVQPIYVREDIVRIDHKINDKFALMGHFVHDGVSQQSATSMWSSDTYASVGSLFVNPSYSAVVKLTQTITPAILNETAFNYDGNLITISPTGAYQQPSGYNVSKYFATNDPVKRLPEIDLGAPYGTNYTVGNWPWHNAAQDYNLKDDLSWNLGRHFLKLGLGYMRYTKNQQLFGETQGNYSFNDSQTKDSLVSFLIGTPASYSELQKADVRHYVNNTYSIYASDDFKATPRLTLNLGFRFDALPHAYERNNRLGNFVPAAYAANQAPQFNSDGSLNSAGPGFSTPAGTSQPFYLNGVAFAGVNGTPSGVVKNYYGTAQPRVGFAYDLQGNGKTVLRGGFGMFFERVQGNDVYNIAPNPPFAYTPSASNVYFSNPSTSSVSGTTAATPVFPSSLVNLPVRYPAPGTAQFSLGVQREVTHSVVGVLQYVGSGGWHQEVDRNINTLPLNSPQRQAVASNTANANLYRQYQGFAGIVQQEDTTNISYNSLQTGIRIQKKYGLSGEADYTWSHEIDIVSNEFDVTSNPFNLEYDRGSGQLDRRNIFNANFVYDLPIFNHSSGLAHKLGGGWQFSGIVIAQSGHPFAPTYGTDVLGLGGGTTNRADLAANKVGYNFNKSGSTKTWFNPASFRAPIAPWAGGGNQGFGDAGKDSIVGPGRFNVNASLFKSFYIAENARFELRADSFNFFNHTQFNNIGNAFTGGDFGKLTSAQDARAFQFAGKFIF